jgi:hypothetical protein
MEFDLENLNKILNEREKFLNKREKFILKHENNLENYVQNVKDLINDKITDLYNNPLKYANGCWYNLTVKSPLEINVKQLVCTHKKVEYCSCDEKPNLDKSDPETSKVAEILDFYEEKDLIIDYDSYRYRYNITIHRAT